MDFGVGTRIDEGRLMALKADTGGDGTIGDTAGSVDVHVLEVDGGVGPNDVGEVDVVKNTHIGCGWARAPRRWDGRVVPNVLRCPGIGSGPQKPNQTKNRGVSCERALHIDWRTPKPPDWQAGREQHTLPPRPGHGHETAAALNDAVDDGRWRWWRAGW